MAAPLCVRSTIFTLRAVLGTDQKNLSQVPPHACGKGVLAGRGSTLKPRAEGRDLCRGENSLKEIWGETNETQPI
jgi:hypothetical protein